MTSATSPQFPDIEQIEILELIGSGGVALVYKARQMNIDRIVAVKVLAKSAIADEVSLRRFQQEAKLSSMVSHPNIATIISFGISREGSPYLVMEYLPGKTLAQELSSVGRLSLKQFRDVFLPVLSALSAAHQAGMIHRDIKPSNIMLYETDGFESVKLLDFGIAKSIDGGAAQNLTKTGMLLGSPPYMSPEQCNGLPIDSRSDLYSLSCVMYEALVGQAPFSAGSALEIMHKHSMEAPPTVAELLRKIEIDHSLASAILSGLAKDPSARPQSAQVLFNKIRPILDQISLAEIPRLKGSKNTGFFDHKLKIFVAAGLIFCLCLLGGFLFSKAKFGFGEDKFSIKEIQRLVLAGKVDQAISRADTFLNTPEFGKMPTDKQADLCFEYFKILSSIRDEHAAMPYLIKFLRLAVPERNFSKTDSFWEQKISIVGNFMSKASPRRAEWEEINQTLKSCQSPVLLSIKNPSGIILLILKEEAELGSQATITPEILYRYCDRLFYDIGNGACSCLTFKKHKRK